MYIAGARFSRLTLSNTLYWLKYVAGISQYVHKSIRLLRFYKGSLFFPLHNHLIETLIFPIVDYAATVCYTLPVSENLRFHRLQNFCVRYVYDNIPCMVHVTPCLITPSWLPPASLCDYFLMTLTCTVVSNSLQGFDWLLNIFISLYSL